MTTTTKTNENAAMLLLKGVPIAMANAIRRTILSNIPVWAIDNVKITTNTGPLHCEYVSHRLSLIPVEQPSALSSSAAGAEDYGPFSLGADDDGAADADDYGPFSSSSGAPPSLLSDTLYKDLTFSINVTTKAQEKIVEVTTKDITVSSPIVTADNIFKEEYLITKLKGNMAFACTFQLSKGIAAKHAKWQAVNTIAYRYFIPGTDSDNVNEIQYDAVSLKQEQESGQGPEEPQGFVFYIEKASLPIPLVLQKAFDHIEETVAAFKTFLETKVEMNEKSWVAGDSAGGSMLEIEYESDETHTLGNLLATYGLLLHPGAFIGYRIIHPMIKKFILRFKFERLGGFEEHKRALGKICETIMQQAQILKTF